MAFNPDNFSPVKTRLFPDTFMDVRRDEETGALYGVLLNEETREIIADTRKMNLDGGLLNNNEVNNNDRPNDR